MTNQNICITIAFQSYYHVFKTKICFCSCSLTLNKMILFLSMYSSDGFSQLLEQDSITVLDNKKTDLPPEYVNTICSFSLSSLPVFTSVLYNFLLSVVSDYSIVTYSIDIVYFVSVAI